MKKTLTILTASILLSIPVFATQPVVVKESPTITLSKDAVHYNNKVEMVPLRIVADKLGMTLEWDAIKRVATLSDGKLSATITPGESLYKLTNHTTLEMDMPAALVDDKLYVPVEFFNQAYDYQVQVVDGNVMINTENPNRIYDDIIMPLNEGINNYYVNQTVAVSLEENPSTGYTWKVDFPTNIKVVSDTFFGSDTKLLGAPGTHNWLLKATKPGTYNITFSKTRGGDQTPVETKTFTLEAKDFVVPN